VLKLLFQAYTALHESSSAFKKKKKKKSEKAENGKGHGEERRPSRSERNKEQKFSAVLEFSVVKERLAEKKTRQKKIHLH
jgi:hypothetical protein